MRDGALSKKKQHLKIMYMYIQNLRMLIKFCWVRSRELAMWMGGYLKKWVTNLGTGLKCNKGISWKILTIYAFHKIHYCIDRKIKGIPTPRISY
jgi:hypothetical protein